MNWMGTNRQKTECNGALGVMIGENRQLVTDEPVELENNWLKIKNAGK